MSEISRQIITAYEVTFWVDSATLFLWVLLVFTLFSSSQLENSSPALRRQLHLFRPTNALLELQLCAHCVLSARWGIYVVASNWHEKCSHFCPLFSHPHACRHHSNYMRIFNNFSSPSTLFSGARVSATAQQQCLSLVHSQFEYA